MHQHPNPTQHLQKRLCATTAALSLACSSLFTYAPVAFAQDNEAKPTTAQLELYTAAIQAYKKGDYTKAIELQRSSLALGELNIIYLNLGRALFRNGDCDAAENAYAKALTAPAVKEPSPEQVSAKVKEFRAELSQCPGIVTVTCAPPNIKISVDGTPPVACNTPLKLPPGTHLITSVGAPKLVQVQVDVKPREKQNVTVEASPEGPIEPKPVPLSENTMFIVGLSIAGAGLLTVGGGVAYDQVVVGGAIDDFEASGSSDAALLDDAESAQTTAGIIYGVGGALLLTGGVLTVLGIVNPPEQDDPEASAHHVTPWMSPDSAGLQWSVTFE